jgi:hypothetical protein
VQEAEKAECLKTSPLRLAPMLDRVATAVAFCWRNVHPQRRPPLATQPEQCLRIIGSPGTLAPGEAPEAVAQVERAGLSAADHSPEVAAR